MEIFTPIDDKLNRFADQYKAEVRTNGLTVPGVRHDEFQLRNIFWEDGAISKGILIHPHLTAMGKDTGLWDFYLLAWTKQVNSEDSSNAFWQKYLLKAANFDKIEKSIDKLLSESGLLLKSIQRKDLRVPKL